MIDLIVFCTLTVTAYLIGARLHRLGLSLTPFVTGCVILVATLYGFDIDYDRYYQGSWPIVMLLTPALIATALPLAQLMKTQANQAGLVVASCLLGGTVAALFAAIAAQLTSDLDIINQSAWVKSVSAPFAMLIAPTIGGHAEFAAGLVAAVGVAGGISAPILFRLHQLTDERLQGLILGITAHGIGMGVAFRTSPSVA